MSLDNEFTILYFWDPECGHCKKITPKLQTLYAKKWRDRNIDIFAIGKCDSKELFEKWKKFIVNKNLEFYNVGLTYTMKEEAMDETPGQPKLRALLQETTLESLNYQQTYDIFATPKVWVLNKDKKIIAYSLTVSQLEDLLDKIQGKEDSEKLFPPTEDQDDEQMH
jgi:thiol-disulfide isomerase/thioredoxin